MAVQPKPEDTRTAREALSDLERDWNIYGAPFNVRPIQWPDRPYDTLPSTFVRTLPKLSLEERCVKCGQGELRLLHRIASFSDVEPHLAKTRNEPFVPVDYIAITCRCCGHTWARRPLDAKE